MSGTFDPYHRWLGVSPKDQPPNHYRLLAIDSFESDREVIRDAAERQMSHVRNYQLGQYSDLSQRILNELAVAKACLLDPQKKAVYDQRLQQALASQVAQEATKEQIVPDRSSPRNEGVEPPPRSEPPQTMGLARTPMPRWLLPTALGGIVLAILGAVFGLSRSSVDAITDKLISRVNPNSHVSKEEIEDFKRRLGKSGSKLLEQKNAVFVGYYYIKAKHSNKYLEIQSASQDAGAQVQQGAFQGGDHQQWMLVMVENGYYFVFAKHSNKCIDVGFADKNDGAKVMQSGLNGGDNQLWKLLRTEDGYCHFFAKHSGKCLDVYYISMDDGAAVRQQHFVGGDNQTWKLQAVTASGTQKPTASSIYSNNESDASSAVTSGASMPKAASNRVRILIDVHQNYHDFYNAAKQHPNKDWLLGVVDQPLTVQALSVANILVVTHCGKPKTYTPEECRAVVDFVRAGGSLLIVGTAWVGITYEKYTEADYPPNQVGTQFGLLMKGSYAGNPAKFASHPITKGLATLNWSRDVGTVSSIDVSDGAKPIIYDSQQHVLCAVREFGKGRVCMMAWNHAMDGCGSGGHKYPEYQQFVQQVFLWLAQV